MKDEVIKVISVDEPPARPLKIKSDLAAEYPVYLYCTEDRGRIVYTTSIVDMLDSSYVAKPLRISSEGVSYILQKGVVPPPQTIFSNLYVLSVGDEALVSVENGLLTLSFSHDFPFRSDRRSAENCFRPDEDEVFKLLAEATDERLIAGKRSFLFHSAGKDSNMLALSLAKAGWQDRVELVSQKSKGKSDESEISAGIAKKLGFKHIILSEPDATCSETRKCLDDYFINSTIPVFDKVTLALPLYPLQLPGIVGCNLIDGGGNDSYMMTPLSRLQHWCFRTSAARSALRPLAQKFFSSISHMNPLTASKFDWCGFFGYMQSGAKYIYPDAVDVRSYGVEQEKLRSKWNYLDFKTDLLTSILASEMHIRKIRTICDVWGSNVVLPYTNQTVANYFSDANLSCLLDVESGRNKVLFRDSLKKHLNLDSDSLGKLGYSFDFPLFLSTHKRHVEDEIFSCRLWDHQNILKEVSFLWHYSQVKSLVGFRANVLLQRLFLLSAWANKNRYVN